MKTMLILSLLILAGCAQSTNNDPVHQTTNINLEQNHVDLTNVGLPAPVIKDPTVLADSVLLNPCDLNGMAPVMKKNGNYYMYVDPNFTSSDNMSYIAFPGIPQSHDYVLIQIQVGKKYEQKSDSGGCGYHLDYDTNSIVVDFIY